MTGCHSLSGSFPWVFYRIDVILGIHSFFFPSVTLDCYVFPFDAFFGFFIVFLPEVTLMCHPSSFLFLSLTEVSLWCHTLVLLGNNPFHSKKLILLCENQKHIFTIKALFFFFPINSAVNFNLVPIELWHRICLSSDPVSERRREKSRGRKAG